MVVRGFENERVCCNYIESLSGIETAASADGQFIRISLLQLY